MTPPRWFWFVIAACAVAATGFYCWNLWYDNQPRISGPERNPLEGVTDPVAIEFIKRAMERQGKSN